jgi:hypothetical protein
MQIALRFVYCFMFLYRKSPSMLLNAFRGLFSNSQNRKARRASGLPRPQLLQLESRIVPANFQVTSLADTATGGTLREAIDLANTTAGNDTIDFASSLFSGGAGTITLLTSQLPQILDASTAISGSTRGTLTITGPGPSTLTISASNGNFRIFDIASGGNLSISGVTVSGAQITTGNGGAFNNAGTLTVSNSTLNNNTTTTNGGGIFNGGTGILTVSNSTLFTNSANHGAGIYNSGTATVTNSTLNSNTATNDGGGINNNGGTLTLTNSTISGNTANAGGGIQNFATLTVTNSTISGNIAILGGGIRNSSTLNIANTIIANSTSGGDYSSLVGTVNLISGATAANNLVSQGTFSWATTVSVLNLGPLTNNGGPTSTMALTNSSPASVKTGGNLSISNASPVNGLDQRGFVRSSTAPSIGAYEFNGVAPSSPPLPARPFSPAFPHALSITTGSGAVATSASFTVTFNQPVIGVDAADFNLIPTGSVANGTISSVMLPALLAPAPLV